MALDYLSIPSEVSSFSSWFLIESDITPATSVDVKHVFSHGCILLSHVHNQLSAQTICALMCVGIWSKFGYVKDEDVLAVSQLPDIDAEKELKEDWDALQE